MFRFAAFLLTICIAFSCIAPNQSIDCDTSSGGIMACPVSTVSMPVLMTFAQHDAVLPTTGTFFVALGVVLAFWGSVIPPKRLEAAKWRYRRRFLHAVLPRYGPQNQFGHLSFISAERAP